METETLRPEFQPLAPSPQLAHHEIIEPSVSQLKQEPTVNHHQLHSNSHPPTSAPDKHHLSAIQPVSPPSDHPISQTPENSQSLHDPKPSSQSTDPLPDLANRRQSPQSNRLPSTSARTPSEAPVSLVEKLHNAQKKPLPARSDAHYPLSLLPFPYFDDDSSDEDEDFLRHYRVMFRRKTESEMASQPLDIPPDAEQSKKPRNTRQSNGKVQKRKAKEATGEIPFSDPKYHKTVGPMVLRPCDIARDLAKIYGREYKEPETRAAKPPLRPVDRKRQRAPEASSAGNGAPQNKRFRQGNANSTEVGDKNAVTEAGRLTRYAKRSHTHSGISSGERGNQGSSNKRAKTGGSPGSVGEIDQKKMFEKHPDKKGWVVCKKCEAAVWPPNCGKHLFHCRKL